MGRRDHLFEVMGLRVIIARAELGFTRLEDVPIPVHAVATDLLSAEPVVLSSGDATQARPASSAIPGVFPPVSIRNRLLVDGGVLANLLCLRPSSWGRPGYSSFPPCPRRSPASQVVLST